MAGDRDEREGVGSTGDGVQELIDALRAVEARLADPEMDDESRRTIEVHLAYYMGEVLKAVRVELRIQQGGHAEAGDYEAVKELGELIVKADDLRRLSMTLEVNRDQFYDELWRRLA